ncbi:MacB family efflux pump subunit [Dickeya undicola]|uniref:Pyoverdine export ATP-binding/permease protein PvdT n=1 Tax=Dickeya undicola TaxID=1577887 RepID=A0A3N0FZ37_9GAMM|nr:MacB family efflux pump subunit [Dickeya undicola]RNM05220.1 MacB family efflux pump subunit [Dickeya undicola]RNM24805.1 MacB family efflux pump subunit [Dickeya undicola]
MSTPLLVLRQVHRSFINGEQRVDVLKNINLAIHAGEMVAIVGASGSGKSTLMNILGCLDKPTQGDYQVADVSTLTLNGDQLAALRREHFGFIFQRYHLLNDLNVGDNVEMPAVYAGQARHERHQRAAALLARLGLAGRLQDSPNQLSGGQQQRVSIARALINGGQVILADEPTGALDSASGEEVLSILHELHQQGHTIVLVTHDMRIAQMAGRIIEIHDGEIVADRKTADDMTPATPTPPTPLPSTTLTSGYDRLQNAFRMALRAMNAQRMRTFLTMLGIIIGIASVVSVVALGKGSQQQVLEHINAMGTSTLEIFPGKDFGDMHSAAIQTLRVNDLRPLEQQPYIHSVTPTVSTSVTLRYTNKAVSVSVNGVGEQFFTVRGYVLSEGNGFSPLSVEQLTQEAVIDQNTRNKLFPNGENPLGQVIFLGTLPCRIIGVATRKQSGFGSDENLNVWLPYTTVMHRMVGQSYLRSITVRVKDNIDLNVAQQGITQILTRQHGNKDFFVMNTDSIRQTIRQTTATMTLLVSAIALISLIVGGIGVMNIMLVSVTERTREIGVRMAVGARTSDIMQQFLIEAVLVCLCGGVLGVMLSLLAGAIASHVSNVTFLYSTASMAAAFLCSSLIGVIFGFFPARRAAQLQPIHALERE